MVQISVDSADDAAAFQNSVAAADIVDDDVSVVQHSVVSADGVVDDDAAFQNFVVADDIVLVEAAEIERMDHGTDPVPLASVVATCVAGSVNH